MISISPFLASRWTKHLKESGMDFNECLSVRDTLEKIFRHRGRFLATEVKNLIATLPSKEGDLKSTAVRNLFAWFILQLKNRKNHSKLKRFLRELEKEILKNFGKRKVLITSANPLSDIEKSRIIKDLERLGINQNDHFEFKTDSSIVGSFKVFIDNRVLDTSFESLVNQFYNR